MITTLAWRNVWRNKTRSLAVILALTIGLFGALLLAGMTNGMVDKWIQTAIDNELSDLQIHNAEYLVMEELTMTMNEEQVKDVLDDQENIFVYTTRVKTEGMAMTANNSTQVNLVGIDPKVESQVTAIKKQLIDGDYLETNQSAKPIVISKRLAEKLKVRMKSKIVFTMSDVDGNVVYDNFKVNGIFETNNALFDNMTVFVERRSLSGILNLDDSQIHEVGIKLKNQEIFNQTMTQLNESLPEYRVRDWRDLNPTLEVTSSSMDLFQIILIGIVLLALIFGIINTMLMVILERTKEIGMLRSLGMKRKKIAIMITMETIFLCLVGGMAGNTLAFICISYFERVGMHFENFKEGMEQFGMSADIYPTLDLNFYIQITLMVVVTAVISSVFPIIRAFKLNPATAIRD